MPETTPRQRRTAASVIEGIQHRLDMENDSLAEAKDLVARIQTRIFTIQAILQDAEKDGEAE